MFSGFLGGFFRVFLGRFFGWVFIANPGLVGISFTAIMTLEAECVRIFLGEDEVSVSLSSSSTNHTDHVRHFFSISWKSRNFNKLNLNSDKNGVKITVKCSGSVTFWYGSRSADPYNRITDPDPDLFFSGCQDAKENWSFCLLPIVGTLYFSLQR